MSLFQCSKCGCLENTALTNMSHCTYLLNREFESNPEHPALKSYKAALGLRPEEPFTVLCSACTPVWYDKAGKYGIGPNPSPSPEEGDGIWHGQFRRMFLPKGKFRTNRVGNLEHTETGSDDVRKWALEKEEGT